MFSEIIAHKLRSNIIISMIIEFRVKDCILFTVFLFNFSVLLLIYLHLLLLLKAIFT